MLKASNIFFQLSTTSSDHGWITEWAYMAQAEGLNVALSCKMSPKSTHINQEDSQNDHKEKQKDHKEMQRSSKETPNNYKTGKTTKKKAQTKHKEKQNYIKKAQTATKRHETTTRRHKMTTKEGKTTKNMHNDYKKTHNHHKVCVSSQLLTASSYLLNILAMGGTHKMLSEHYTYPAQGHFLLAAVTQTLFWCCYDLPLQLKAETTLSPHSTIKPTSYVHHCETT